MSAPWGGPWLPLAFHDAEGMGQCGPVLCTGRAPSLARIGMPSGAPLTLPTQAHVEALMA